MSNTRRGNRGKQISDAGSNPRHDQQEEETLQETRTARKTPPDNENTPGRQDAITHPDFEADLRDYIARVLGEQTAHIVSKMDNIVTEVKELHTKTDEMLALVEFNAKDIESNKSEINKVKTDMEEMRAEFENKLLIQEMYSRKNNLLIYGVPDEKDSESAARETFGLIGVKEAADMMFVNVHRLPRKSSDPVNFRASMPKPIVVKFVRVEDRQTVFNASFKNFGPLKEKKITIRTDLPVVLKKQRGRLANRAFDLRKKYQVQTRILERGIELSLQIRKTPQQQWRTIDIDETP